MLMNGLNQRIVISLALAVLAVSACTTVPTQLEGMYTEISPARVEPGVYGSTVRWGGVILDAKNKENQTCFEILSRDLSKYMRPLVEDSTAGRFIACKEGFHDPEVFAKGREVTLTGQIRSMEVRQIDEFNYRYPVVDISHLVLWEIRKDVLVYDHYDPFFSPYYWGWGYSRYPYYGFPYYGYPYYGMGYSRRGRTHVYTRQTTPDPAIIESRDE